MSKLNHRIIIGVDYGTTYTGVSYVDSGKKSIDDIDVIRHWPGPGKAGDSVWKVPSRIAYSDENSGCSSNQFGYDVLPKMKSYSWTKLLLDESTSFSKYGRHDMARSEGTGLMKLPPNKTATDVAGDYLREIYKWTKRYIEKRIGPEVTAVTPFEFWLTVPAIWTDKAKAATEEAARAAGFASREGDEIYIISEPEAAAVAVLKKLTQEDSIAQVKPGDGVLVCDCGGGTVDITTYKISDTRPMLVFEELVEGTGGKCGSTYIDRKFYEWMSQTFGKAFDDLKFDKKGPGSRFMIEFEGHKKDFGSSTDLNKVYEINLVMPQAEESANYDSDECVVKLTGHNLLEFFNATIRSILILVEQQMQNAAARKGSCNINLIILAGGFGDSLHLISAMRSWCSWRQGLRLICPEHPQAAVVRGAALRGLENTAPVYRRSRRHYGFGIKGDFREGVDSESSKTYCKWYNIWFCNNRVSWQIKKGQSVNEETKCSEAVKLLWKKGDDMRSRVRLYSCSLENAPDYRHDEGVVHVGNIWYNLMGLDFSKFESRIIDEELTYKVEFNVEVIMGHRRGTLQFQVISNDEVLQTSTIDYM